MPRMLTTSEEGVDERGDSRAFGEHEQHAARDECDDDRGEPELLVLPHELPQLIDDVEFRHSKLIFHAKAQRIAKARKISTFSHSALDFFVVRDTAPRTSRAMRRDVAVGPSPSRALSIRSASTRERKRSRG